MSEPDPTNAVLDSELSAWLQDTLRDNSMLGAALPSVSALQTEASFRQFYRVHGARQPLVLMNSPPDKEHNDQFATLAAAFARDGLCVPQIFAHNRERGWLLLSDLGTQHFIDLYRDQQAPRCLAAAMFTLQRLQRITDPAIPPYTQSRLADELQIFTDYIADKACDVAVPEPLFRSAETALLANAADQPQVCVHRDFHCKNLLLIGPKSHDSSPTDAADQVGVLDFQDALIGPAGYDLASLIYDCYWTFPDQVIDAQIEQAPNLSRRHIDLLAVQRQLKAIGIFARLALRDGKHSHLRYIDPVLGNLIKLCARYPELSALGGWLESQLQETARHWVQQTLSAAAS